MKSQNSFLSRRHTHKLNPGIPTLVIHSICFTKFQSRYPNHRISLVAHLPILGPGRRSHPKSTAPPYKARPLCPKAALGFRCPEQTPEAIYSCLVISAVICKAIGNALPNPLLLRTKITWYNCWELSNRKEWKRVVSQVQKESGHRRKRKTYIASWTRRGLSEKEKGETRQRRRQKRGEDLKKGKGVTWVVTRYHS